MNKLLCITIILTFFSVQNTALFAQPGKEGTYIKITYLNVVPDATGSVLEEAGNSWGRHQQKRVDDGDILRWHFYKVPYSGDRQKSYNFVSLESATDLNALQATSRPSALEYRKKLKETSCLKYTVHSEIWKIESVVHDGLQQIPSRYMNVNYMRAASGRLNEYLELETDIARPLHTHQMENERMDGWAFHRLVFPTGVSAPFNFITADFYSNLQQIEMGITRQVIGEVHPDMDVDEFESFADAIRERVHSDLWELLEYAIAE